MHVHNSTSSIKSVKMNIKTKFRLYQQTLIIHFPSFCFSKHLKTAENLQKKISSFYFLKILKNRQQNLTCTKTRAGGLRREPVLRRGRDRSWPCPSDQTEAVWRVTRAWRHQPCRELGRDTRTGCPFWGWPAWKGVGVTK